MRVAVKIPDINLPWVTLVAFLKKLIKLEKYLVTTVIFGVAFFLYWTRFYKALKMEVYFILKLKKKALREKKNFLYSTTPFFKGSDRVVV